jgi:hypothetical protein
MSIRLLSEDEQLEDSVEGYEFKCNQCSKIYISYVDFGFDEARYEAADLGWLISCYRDLCPDCREKELIQKEAREKMEKRKNWGKRLICYIIFLLLCLVLISFWRVCEELEALREEITVVENMICGEPMRLPVYIPEELA